MAEIEIFRPVGTGLKAPPGAPIEVSENASEGSRSGIILLDDLAGGVEPKFDENFSGYADMNALMSAWQTPTGWISGTVQLAPDGFGESEQCLRAIFPGFADDAPNRCDNTTSGVTLDMRPFVSNNAEELGHLWVELWYRFSSSWTSSWPRNTTAANEDWGDRDHWDCSPSSPDYKLFFLQQINGRAQYKHGWTNNQRHEFGWGNSTIGSGHHRSGAEEQLDNQWHRMRMMAKHSSGPSVADARLIGWAGDDAMSSPTVDESGVADDHTHFYGFALGRNRNHRAYVDMHVDFGRVSVWNQRPDWDTYSGE